MSRPRATRLRADERFARMLEVSASASAASADPDLRPMVDLANALRGVSRVAAPAGPDPEFRAALRQRLVAVATVQAPEPAGVRRGRAAVAAAASYRIRRRVAVLAGMVTVATSFAGVGLAAARSLPGDPFYDVKRATEAVQLWTAHGDLAKGERHLEFAKTRLAEARALPSSSSHIASTLAAMNSQTTQASAELISAYRSSHSTTPLSDLVAFSRSQLAGLVALEHSLPPAVRGADVHAIGVVVGVVKQVHVVAPGLCVVCPSQPGHRSGPGGHQPQPRPTPDAHPSHPSARSSQPPSGHGTTPPRHSASTHPSRTPTPHPSLTLPIPLPTITLPIPVPTLSLLSPLEHKHPLPKVSKLLKDLGL